MQTNFRKVRIIIARKFGRTQSDNDVIECAAEIIKELTGKKPATDIVSGLLEMNSEKEIEMREIIEILETFERELRRADNISGDSVWQDFAKGFIRKELKAGHDYHTWLSWFRQDPERMEWAWKETPQRIRSRWLMAFDNAPAQKLPSGV